MPRCTAPSRAAQPALLERWLRMQMHVRCGLSAHLPGSVRAYLHTGVQVAWHRLMAPDLVHLRMLHNLLQAAHDEALPWFWRSVCLEHVNLPLAHATSLLSVHDPIALRAIEASVQVARDRLPIGPSAGRLS